jgi:hypothetical protein
MKYMFWDLCTHFIVRTCIKMFDTASRLASLYSNPLEPSSFSGIKKLHNASNHEIKKSEIEKYLRSQSSYNKYIPYRNKYVRRVVMVPEPFYLFQADLLVLDKLSRYKSGYKYILSVIDCFSRVAYVTVLKKKTGEEVSVALDEIFDKFGPCKYLQTDEGTEFFNSKVRHILEKWVVTHFHNNSDTKACIVERFQRTLMSKIFRYFEHYHTKTYINVLDDIVTAYNNTIHSSLGRSPSSVTKENEMDTWLRIYRKLYETKWNMKPKYQEGNFVRIKTKRSTFFKGYAGAYSERIFKISEVLKSYPITYKLVDEEGSPVLGIFYKQELSLVTQ